MTKLQEKKGERDNKLTWADRVNEVKIILSFWFRVVFYNALIRFQYSSNCARQVCTSFESIMHIQMEMTQHGNKMDSNELLMFQGVAIVLPVIWGGSAFICLQILNNLSEYDLFGWPPELIIWSFIAPLTPHSQHQDEHSIIPVTLIPRDTLWSQGQADCAILMLYSKGNAELEHRSAGLEHTFKLMFTQYHGPDVMVCR